MSFSVGAGETAVLLGPNGSGKSTLLRCLVGFFSPTAGSFEIDGIDVADGGIELRRRVGYLPESVVLYPDLTVRRYLRFVGGVKGLAWGECRRRVAEVIERCGLGDVTGRPAGVLSKGYRQRVGVAQALLGDPDVLVLDEPTVGLDPVQTIELRTLLGSLEDCTVLLSTHLLAEASQLCDRVVILNGGQLLAEDTPAGLAERTGLGRCVLVRVDGPRSEVTAVLAALEHVEAAAAREEPGEAILYGLHTSNPQEVQRTVARAVVERGWTLLEMREEAPTLEDLFVRLVG